MLDFVKKSKKDTYFNKMLMGKLCGDFDVSINIQQ